MWGLETRKTLAGYVAQIAQIKETDRRPPQCISAPAIWMALAALCICEQSYIELYVYVNTIGMYLFTIILFKISF